MVNYFLGDMVNMVPWDMEISLATTYRPKKIEGYDDVRFIHVSAGLSYTVAIADDGKIYSWGSGNFGKLGHYNLDDEYKPKLISKGNIVFTQVHCGKSHSVALISTGSVYTWRCGENGRIGHSNEKDVHVPTKVESLPLNCVAVGAGYYHTFALHESGKLYVWGSGKEGKLGLGRKKQDCLP